MSVSSKVWRLTILALLLAPLVVASPALAEDFIQAGAFFFDGDPNVQTKSIKGAGLEHQSFPPGVERAIFNPIKSPVRLSFSEEPLLTQTKVVVFSCLLISSRCRVQTNLAMVGCRGILRP
jgi:hypothetical protein